MINIDLTTKNTVYNTLGPQAQWVQHRFGRRDYPDIDLETTLVEQIVNSNKPINFISMFGDPSCHPDILKILDFVDTGKVIFNTHLNFDNDELIVLLNSKNAYVVVPIYGVNELADKILLHSDWQCIKKNLANLTCNVCIEFYLFEHNFHQLAIIKKLCNTLSIELKIKSGISLHPNGFSPIVDENKNWLYDIHSCHEDSVITQPNLNKTVLGYNSLIQYIKPLKGQSILSKPNFYKIAGFKHTGMTSISVTGHVFPSFEIHQIFSNALCTDWNFSFSNITDTTKIVIKPEFNYLCSALTSIVDMINVNCLTTYKYEDILTNFANSNI